MQQRGGELRTHALAERELAYRLVEQGLFRSETVDRRIAGIHDAMQELGMRFVVEESCWEWEPHHGFELTRRILAAHPDIRGVLCLNDRLAFGAYQALAEAGRRVPDNVAVLGFDNDEIAAYLRPGLTTLALPHHEMGRRAVELLLGEAEPAATHLVEMPVVVRQSLPGT